MLSILSYVSGPSVCPPWRSSVQVICPFFNCVGGLPGVETCEFFISFGDQTLDWGVIGKYIFQYSWLPFHFADVFFSNAEAFYFEEVPFVYSFLFVPCSRGRISENIAVWNIWDFPAYVLFQDFYGDWVSYCWVFFAYICPDLPTPFFEQAIFILFYAPAPCVKY